MLQNALILFACSSFIICDPSKSAVSLNETAHMALMIYEPPKVFDIFQAGSREFSFAGHVLNISQNWKKNGVAAVVWDAAIVLARYLESSVDIGGKTIIELGAGTGLVGLVAGLLGAHVTITDRKMALALAEENVKRNRAKFNTRVEVRELEWGQNISEFSPPFDYILGADIVYIEESFTQLLRTIRELSSDQTTVLLSCRIRYQRDHNFLQLLRETFNVEQVLYDTSMDIYVYKATKKRIQTL